MRRLIAFASLTMALTTASGGARAADYVLAMSWEPAFCALQAAKGRAGDKPECGTRLPSSYGATNFILHGLWPQPESNSYCGVPADIRQYDVPGQWDKLPAVQYGKDGTKAEMATYMPGAVSYLDRHEWTKHGTCSKMIPDDYFTLGFGLVKEMANTRTAKLIAANIGKDVQSSKLCDSLAADFGSTIMKSAEIKTSQVTRNGRKQTVMSEIWIYLTDREDGKLALSPFHLATGYGTLKCGNQPLRVVASGG
ncbi:MAG: hypothetical protein K2Q10_07165 [Rhodospirillales bacterium]|nr:hypothetical protein [Rhodospirillales bacterium]